MSHEHKPIDLDSLKALSEEKGRTWRSLEDLAGTEGFNEFFEREFPRYTAPWAEAIDRRQFLKLMGASAALAGLAACRPQVEEKIVPYVKKPEEMIPGEPLFYASSFVLGGYANGILVETHDGRPTKIEGNPGHPGSMGATDAWAQAATLGLYDPDRSQAVLSFGAPSTLKAASDAMAKELTKHAADKGARVRILTETVTSPTLAAQLRAFLAKYPAATWHQYQAVNTDNAFEGAKLAFGRPVEAVYRFDKAAVVVSLDSDFMSFGPGRVRYMGDFAEARRVGSAKQTMNRFYAVEGTPTVTGAKADHRVPMKSSEVEAFARALAGALGVAGAGAPSMTGAAGEMLQAAAQDLGAARGSSIVIAGDHLPASVHAIAHAINAALGNAGKTVHYIASPQAEPVNQGQSMKSLVDAVNGGKVGALVVLGGNPVHSAPSDLQFGAAISKVEFTVHASDYLDETSALCKWHVPLAHDLEAWGDARAYDGTASIIQPTIEPLYGAPSCIEVVEMMLGGTREGLAIVRDVWSKSGVADEKAWRAALHEGVISKATAPSGVAANTGLMGSLPPVETGDGVEVVVLPDSTLYDGRFANNGWLQELPKPLSSLTWDNVVKVSRKTAEQLGIAQSIGGTGANFTVPIVEVSVNGVTVQGPALITPGQADDSICVTMGFGRAKAGVIGNGVGFDVNPLRTMANPWISSGAKVTVVSRGYDLATTQNHYAMEGRELVRMASLEEFRKDPEFAKHVDHEGEELSMYPEREYTGNSWGMVIDTTVCTGCNACITACQAENNIPIVGKEQVARGREMHWLRIDRYYQGGIDAPVIHHLPVLCMHCEQAPCEVVCPVAATTHGHEGLNEMVYNRCVGTRYCSNNCPYKVRRFNFRFFTDNVTTNLPSPNEAPVLKLINNPNVTVRGRGIMEKCSYCVQRINSARKHAKRDGRPIKDGEVVTACQGACPTKAIVFGNINDKESRIAKAKAEPHEYSLLKELNTRPRTTYLAKVVNPNPNIKTEGAHAE